MLISEIEDDGKRVPVLIKHYLKLNGRFIAFNVDHAFCEAVDGLVVVDLMRTDTRLLKRFLGKDGVRRFLAHWEKQRKNGFDIKRRLTFFSKNPDFRSISTARSPFSNILEQRSPTSRHGCISA